MRKKSELVFSLILVPIDFLVLLASFIAAYAIRVKLEARPVVYPLGIEFFIQVFLFIIPVWILFFALIGLYNQSSLRGRLQEWGRIIVATSAGFMFMLVVDYISKSPLFPSKAVPIYAYGISIVALILSRELVRDLQRSLFRIGIGTYRTVIIGSGKMAQELVKSLHHTKTSGYKIIGALDTAKGAQGRMSPIIVDSSLSNLLNRLNGDKIDEIIQADSSLEQEEVFEMVEYAANNHITYKFIPNQFGLFASHSEIQTMAGMPMVALKRTPLDGWGRIVKRAFDLVASIFGLVVLSPLFLAIAFLIKLTDPGPVYYKHKRLSRVGKVIYVYKFRSMKTKFSKGKFKGLNDIEVFQALGRDDLVEEFRRDQKVKRDPRVSAIGGFLRRSSLDELPQLINILRGDISLVGPRPIVESELKKYGSGRHTLLSLKPGLTGLWQVSGRNDISYEDRVKLDLYYIENWSLWLDIRIILKTIWIVLTNKGAY